MADKKGAPGLDIDNKEYKMRLFVTGASVNSARAIANLKVILETYLKGKYKLDIIDVHQEPQKAALEQIIALPLLIKSAPGVERRLIGDMSNREKVLSGLGISV
jgi:circadian clock protein KaiB